jgi:hypothetical protein
MRYLREYKLELEHRYFSEPKLKQQIGVVRSDMRWSRLSEQDFRFDRWSICQG